MEAEALNTFGTQLLKRWRHQNPEDSVVFSPLSLAGAFALLFPGACGATRAELDSVFGFEVHCCSSFSERHLMPAEQESIAVSRQRRNFPVY